MSPKSAYFLFPREAPEYEPINDPTSFFTGDGYRPLFISYAALMRVFSLIFGVLAAIIVDDAYYSDIYVVVVLWISVAVNAIFLLISSIPLLHRIEIRLWSDEGLSPSSASLGNLPISVLVAVFILLDVIVGINIFVANLFWIISVFHDDGHIEVFGLIAGYIVL
jgi:hypothetical protein